MIKTYLAPSQATSKGRLTKQWANVQSTRPTHKKKQQITEEIVMEIPDLEMDVDVVPGIECILLRSASRCNARNIVYRHDRHRQNNSQIQGTCQWQDESKIERGTEDSFWEGSRLFGTRWQQNGHQRKELHICNDPRGNQGHVCTRQKKIRMQEFL